MGLRTSFHVLLLLLLSRFSRVRHCVTPEMATHQALLSLAFSRQEHWSGLPFSSPTGESEVAQSCPTPSDPMDCSLPGSSVHRICHVRVLEWLAIAFSVKLVRKTKTMASGPVTSWQIDGEKVETVSNRFYFHGLQNHCGQ